MRERLATLRILIGAYALVYVVLGIGELASVSSLPATRFSPVGVVRVLDQPLPVWLVTAIAVMTVVLLAGFVAGVAYRVVAPLAAAALLWTLSYRSSWGMIFHTDDLLVLHVIALAISPAADARALGRSSRDGGNYDLAVKLVVALTAVTYVLAGIAKLRIAGLHWLSGDLLRDQIAFDNARKALLGDPIAPFATLLLDHPGSLVVASIVTLVIELGAPIALLGGTIARGWAVSAWIFHVGVVLTMNVWFPYPLFGFAFVALFPIERLRLPRQLRV